MSHIPVLLKEVLEYLDPQAGRNYVDATFGGGGHSQVLLERIKPLGKVLAIDLDKKAIEEGNFQFPISNFQNRLILVHGNFADLLPVAGQNGFNQVAGILFDLGLSSDLLDDPKRGFSFQKAGPLDMRFDQGRGVAAAQLVSQLSEKQLSSIFKEYGEEPFAKNIARAIVNNRAVHSLNNTEDLFNLIKKSLPANARAKAGNVARRVFQALRIVVNHELENLQKALPQALQLLQPGGRLIVISFHSLEDRIVKKFFQEQALGCTCPPEFPKCICGKNPSLKVLTRKPITASEEEILKNPKAKSAKLRAAEKV